MNRSTKLQISNSTPNGGISNFLFQNRKPVRVSLYHCISDGNRQFSENVGCHFHFILHVMSDKAAFVRGALLCVPCYRGNLDLSRSNMKKHNRTPLKHWLALAQQWKTTNLELMRQVTTKANQTGLEQRAQRD